MWDLSPIYGRIQVNVPNHIAIDECARAPKVREWPEDLSNKRNTETNNTDGWYGDGRYRRKEVRIENGAREKNSWRKQYEWETTCFRLKPAQKALNARKSELLTIWIPNSEWCFCRFQNVTYKHECSPFDQFGLLDALALSVFYRVEYSMSERLFIPKSSILSNPCHFAHVCMRLCVWKCVCVPGRM